MAVVVTSNVQPTVNSCRSDIGRSGLMRSGSTGPESGITAGLVNWRKATGALAYSWRAYATYGTWAGSRATSGRWADASSAKRSRWQ